MEEHGGELCGCATVVVDEDLTERGWNDLQGYLSGQYSDGWGEGFEQRDIQVEDGNLNVHFWQEEHFTFTVEQVTAEPQVALAKRIPHNRPQPIQPAKKYEITDVAHPSTRNCTASAPCGRLEPMCLTAPSAVMSRARANLSQEDDDAWIYGEAICRDDALVRDGALLTDLCPGQWLCPDRKGSRSRRLGQSSGQCRRFRRPRAGKMPLICGDAILRKSQRTGYAPMVEGNATVMGNGVRRSPPDGRGVLFCRAVVLENPTADVLGIHGTHAHLYRTETPDRPKSPKHLER